MPVVASPCINVCAIDQDSGLCRGCLRTLDEIVDWAAATEERKLTILAAVDQRRADNGPPGRSIEERT